MGCLFFALSFLAASNTANASCGDYLHTTNHRAAHAPGVNDKHLPVKLFGKTTPVTPQCSGPECHQAPLPPVGTSQPDYQRATFKDLCALLNTIDASDNGWTWLGQISNVSLKSPDRDRLNRPPQLS